MEYKTIALSTELYRQKGGTLGRPPCPFVIHAISALTIFVPVQVFPCLFVSFQNTFLDVKLTHDVHDKIPVVLFFHSHRHTVIVQCLQQRLCYGGIYPRSDVIGCNKTFVYCMSTSENRGINNLFIVSVSLVLHNII